MPIVSKLRRPCSRCNELYVPDGKMQKICINCNIKFKGWNVTHKNIQSKRDKNLLAYNKLKEEYSKVLHDETLKKFYILNKALDIGYKIYGKSKFSMDRLATEFDIPYTTVYRILSLRRANEITWKLIKSRKLSSFKATQILLTKNNRLQNQIVKAVINDNLSTTDIAEYSKVTTLQEFKKIRLDRAIDKGFARKDTAYLSFIHYISQMSKMLDLKKDNLPEDKIPEIAMKLIILKNKIDSFIN